MLGSAIAASCADCHGAHGILPSTDERSRTHQGNLVETCGACHENARPAFVKYDSHPDPFNRARNPWIFASFLFMNSVLIMTLVVFVEQSQRRVPVQYAKRMVGRRTYGGNNTYIPIKVNMAGVVPVIFASSLLYLPLLVTQFFQPAPGEDVEPWVAWVQSNLASGDNALYMAIYFGLIIFFTYFYVSITFNPTEVADNMKKYGGFIPGIRAGKPTEDYLSYVLSRITAPGALYLGLIALIPLIALVLINANQNFPFGGTSILIMVGVALDTVKQIESQLQQRNYEGFLR